MKTIVEGLVAVLAGTFAFVAGTVVVTATLDPHVWPSLLVGLPVGITVGVTATLAALAAMRYREGRRVGDLSPDVVGAYRAAVVAVAACVFVVPVGIVAVILDVGEVGIALLVVGLPASVLVGAAVAYLTTRRRGRPGREQAA
ncbi:hypothetical protein [Haloarchaeobius sp. HRN-SO-5]|uniref:hypothetical protein n=1 Tax=Haloarchaeobius sp. HRN-SO-5 TaxID=3446118 RepID=UPI003EB84BE7